MKRLFLLSLMLMIVSALVWANPPDSLWSKTYGGPDYDNCNVMIKTSDDGFAMAGVTSSNNEYSFALLIKTDQNGDSLWSRSYGDEESYNQAVGLVQTPDDGYAILIEKMISLGNAHVGDGSAWLIKTDEDGNIEWDRTFFDEEDVSPTSLIQTLDGGFALVGVKGYGGDSWLIKTDEDGEEQWHNYFDDIHIDGQIYVNLYDIIQIDSDYVVVGEMRYPVQPGPYSDWTGDMAMLKVSSEGNILWSRNYDQAEGHDDRALFVMQTSDGGFAVGGSNNHPVFVRTDGSGELLWNIDGPGEYIAGAIETDDGFMIACGESEFAQQFSLIETANDGQIIWQEGFGTHNHRQPVNSIVQTDNGFVVGGTSYANELGTPNFWLIGFGYEVNVSQENQPVEFTVLSAYPNPFNSSARINFTLPKAGKVSFTVYNAGGQEVQQSSNFFSVGTHNLVVNGSRLTSGVYFAELKTNTFNQVQTLYLVK